MMNTNHTSPAVLAGVRIEFFGLPKSTELLKQVDAFLLSVQEKSKIDSVDLKFTHREDQSPAYGATLHLAVPGPDLRMEHHGATLTEAWQKVCADVMKRLQHRDAKRVAARKRTEPLRQAAH